MSTKRKKLYNKEDILSSQKDLKEVEGYFTKRTSKRKTVQVRISEKWHRKIKEEAGPKKIMLSFFMDKICEYFFNRYE